MLDAAVPVHDHAHVNREVTATFWHDKHVFGTGSTKYPLALITSRLHVALYTKCAHALEALYM